MACQQHEGHSHKHGNGCGHLAVSHEGHTDYLHEGHMHHVHDGHVDEHQIARSTANPEACTPGHKCEAHAAGHVHGPGCGHEAVPHGDHTDFISGQHLHHPHNGHCDDHGAIRAM